MKMREGTRHRVESEFARARGLTRADPGMVSFDLNRHPSEPDQYVVYERWRSLQEFEAHLRTPHFSALRSAFDDMLVGGPELTALVPAD